MSPWGAGSKAGIKRLIVLNTRGSADPTREAADPISTAIVVGSCACLRYSYVSEVVRTDKWPSKPRPSRKPATESNQY